MSYEPLADQNPLLEIDTSFYSYLVARMRNFKEHMTGGKLDYAFDAEFAMKQKINGASGWSKLQNFLFSHDIPIKVKNAFRGANIAGSLKFADAYEAAKICAERLQMSVPTVFVRNVKDKYEIFSLTSDNDEYIILTSGLMDICSKEELCFLVGCECGHIQNGHCVYAAAIPGMGVNKADGVMTGSDEIRAYDALNKQIEDFISDWLEPALITSDRAGILCCDNPENYPKIVTSTKKKGVADFYRKADSAALIAEWGVSIDKLLKDYDILRKTPARSIKLDPSLKALERRIFAGMEFLSCETLFSWRSDLLKDNVHIVNKQALEARCEIIVTNNKQ